MAISAFVAQTALKFGMNSLTSVSEYFLNKEADRTNFSNIQTQAALNNQISTLNEKLINEDEIREMRAFGLDMAELARQSNELISGTKTSNPHAIGTRTGDALIRNASAAGARARFVQKLNFGTKLRGLGIERLNNRLRTDATNTALFKQFKPAADIVKTGLQIASAGTGAAKQLLAKKIETGRV